MARSGQDIVNAIIFSVIYSYFVLYFAQFYIKERVCRSKLLQMISGANKMTFWLTSFAYDFLIYLIITVLLVGVMAAFQNVGWSTFPEVFRVFLILFCFGIAILPLLYLTSYIFNKPATSDSLMFLFNILFGEFFFDHFVISFDQLNFIPGPVLYGIYTVLLYVESTKKIFQILYWFFLAPPNFALMDTFIKLMNTNSSKYMCLTMCHGEANCNIEMACTKLSECCCE